MDKQDPTLRDRECHGPCDLGSQGGLPSFGGTIKDDRPFRWEIVGPQPGWLGWRGSQGDREWGDQVHNGGCMPITKRDLNTLARAIRDLPVFMEQVTVCEQIGLVCAQSNPRFQWDRWRTACTPPSQEEG